MSQQQQQPVDQKPPDYPGLVAENQPMNQENPPPPDPAPGNQINQQPQQQPLNQGNPPPPDPAPRNQMNQQQQQQPVVVQQPPAYRGGQRDEQKSDIPSLIAAFAGFFTCACALIGVICGYGQLPWKKKIGGIYGKAGIGPFDPGVNPTYVTGGILVLIFGLVAAIINILLFTGKFYGLPRAILLIVAFIFFILALIISFILNILGSICFDVSKQSSIELCGDLEIMPNILKTEKDLYYGTSFGAVAFLCGCCCSCGGIILIIISAIRNWNSDKSNRNAT